MKIYGLDFTSAPNPRKPITCAAGRLTHNRLKIYDLTPLVDFAALEEFLSQPGPWLAGLDFPFGQPRPLIDNLGWPDSWEGYVQEIARLGKVGFEQTLAAYRRARPPGDKQHRRTADVKANSRSPMMWSGVPVGKMFFEGAPRLLKAGVSILPCRPNDDTRMVVEAYPALVARRYGTGSYKNDVKRKQSPTQETARRAIVAGVHSDRLRGDYGFSLEFSDIITPSIIQDPSGDRLDAVLCAIQAAYAHRQRDHNYSIPPDCDSVEGWIIDPGLP
ncbi:MAG: DUF429 domain-containing protein [Chloroflexi bacterium]|nr:DUF429 domain-containing protein [Chloroflexota bacterium]